MNPINDYSQFSGYQLWSVIGLIVVSLFGGIAAMWKKLMESHDKNLELVKMQKEIAANLKQTRKILHDLTINNRVTFEALDIALRALKAATESLEESCPEKAKPFREFLETKNNIHAEILKEYTKNGGEE